MIERKAIILDLDNTISDDSWRIPKISWESANPLTRYHNYHLLAGFDEAKNSELWEMCEEEEIEIYIFTARPSIYQAISMEWLERKGIKYEAMFMRPDDNHSKSVELKKQQLYNLFNKFDLNPSNIIGAYDDREDVIKMYRENNVAGQRVCIHNICAYTSPIGDHK